MPDINSILRQISQWKYIITTDLTNAFFQIPLQKDSMKYCGVATPFKGIRVYTRCAMGMPGSETALEELMCRVLGHLLEEGCIAKLADDLYCGGNTIDEIIHNWSRVLEAIQVNGLRLSPNKTIICPKSTTVLGWIWSNGYIKASPHRVATLSSCSPPDTVKATRSFIGAYKVLARVIPNCSSLLCPLDDLVAGKQSSDKIQWTEDSVDKFKHAQQALCLNKSIVLPRPNDRLWIVTDGAVKNHGIGATLYVTRQSKTLLAGFFSAKLRGRQPDWIPCEIEALAIAVATRHFSPYIIQSSHTTCILTDSKPCVQAFEKLCRGEFSVSPRISTYLSTVSRYQASVRHLAGSVNLPSDFASRNAPECTSSTCQICSFVRESEESVVRKTSLKDFKVPYTNRAAWKELQNECQNLRRTFAHLTQGTRPSKKLTNIKDVKRYLNIATIAKDGLLVIRKSHALENPRECIIVPRSVVSGLLTSLHLQLDHPSNHQLKLVFDRQFFALDIDKIIDVVTSSCHQCTSLRHTPTTVITQSSSDPPETVGTSFAADIFKRERQLILVVRECVTSYTVSTFIEKETAECIREALIKLCIELRPLDGPIAVIRSDPAPEFKSLENDRLLHHHRLSIEIGRVKNTNKNPVAEKAIQELQTEILRQQPVPGQITTMILTLATARLNTRIRSNGMSSREMWTQRDQFTSSQLPISDLELITQKQRSRSLNHENSEKSKAPSNKIFAPPSIQIGDLVYLHADGSKIGARPRYLVTNVDGQWCNIRKFIGHQLRKTSYRVKVAECYKVRDTIDKIPQPDTHEDEDDDWDPVPVPDSPAPPSLKATPPVLLQPFPIESTAESLAHTPLSSVDSPQNDRSMHCESTIGITATPENNLELPRSSPQGRRSSRARQLPKHLQDYVLNS